MTKWIAMSVLALAVSLGSTGPAMAQQTTAFINMEQVFADYYKTQRADIRLKDQAGAYNDARAAIVDALRSMEENFNTVREEAQDQTLSEEARTRKRSEAEQQLLALREKEKELREFEETKRKELEEQGRRMRERIVDEINEVIATYAKENDLFAVVDSSGPSLNRIPVFVYADPTADITANVVAILNESEGEDLLLAPERAEDDPGTGADAASDDAGTGEP